MLKILKTMLIAFLLLFSMPMVAFADNHEDVEIETTSEDVEEGSDDEADEEDSQEESDDQEVVDETEAIILKDINGAKVRVLQLVKRIKHQIEDGTLVVNYIEENTEEDTTELNQIIADLEGILVDIEEFDPTGKSASELAEAYTGVKAEAIELSHSFKSIVSSILTDEEKAELRETIKARNDDRKSQKDENIENLKFQYNKEKAREIAERLGFDSSVIKEKFEGSNLTPAQIKERIVGEFRGLNNEQKEKFVVKLKEENQKLKVEAREREGELRAKYEDKINDLEMKLKERSDKFEARVKSEGRDFRVKVEDDRLEIRDGRNTRIEQRDDGRLKMEFRDRPGQAIGEINALITKKKNQIERLSQEEGSEDKIARLENQIENLEEAISKIEQNLGNIKKIKIEEEDDGELEIEIETEDEDHEDEMEDHEEDSDDEDEHDEEDSDEESEDEER